MNSLVIVGLACIALFTVVSRLFYKLGEKQGETQINELSNKITVINHELQVLLEKDKIRNRLDTDADYRRRVYERSKQL